MQTEEYKDRYKELRKSNNLDELEKLIRDRITSFPTDDEYTKNQLVGVLVDKIKANPHGEEFKKTIQEIESLLEELGKKYPNNVVIVSTNIKFARIMEDADALEKCVRRYLELQPDNVNKKIQLGNLLLKKYKSSKYSSNSVLNEVEKIGNSVLEKKPRNSYAMNLLLKSARLKGDYEKLVELLRQSKELNIYNPLLNNLLSGALVACCLDDVQNGKEVKKDDERLIEAKDICTSVLKDDPKNPYIITYLITVARIEKDKKEEKRLLRLKLEINPDDEKAQRGLGISKTMEYEDDFTVEDFMDNETEESSNSLKSKYGRSLLSAINAGDRELTLKVLKEIKQDEEISLSAKKHINQMIDLAKSNKPKSKITLRGMAQDMR